MSQFRSLLRHTWNLKTAILWKKLGVTSSNFQDCLVFMIPTTGESLKKIWAVWVTFSIFSWWFDMKLPRRKILLHLVNHATKIISINFCPIQRANLIINAIFGSWIQIFGAPKKFLTDNGGNFVNTEFLEMCELMNITVKVTAAEQWPSWKA